MPPEKKQTLQDGLGRQHASTNEWGDLRITENEYPPQKEKRLHTVLMVLPVESSAGVIVSEVALLGFLGSYTVYYSTYRKGTSIRQAPVFRHLRALRKSPWKFIIWMNEL